MYRDRSDQVCSKQLKAAFPPEFCVVMCTEHWLHSIPGHTDGQLWKALCQDALASLYRTRPSRPLRSSDIRKNSHCRGRSTGKSHEGTRCTVEGPSRMHYEHRPTFRQLLSHSKATHMKNSRFGNTFLPTSQWHNLPGIKGLLRLLWLSGQ